MSQVPAPPPTVVVPFDFSPSAEAAVLEATRFALAFGWRMLLLHVVHDPARAPGFYLQRDAGHHDDEKERKKGKKARKGLRKHVRTMTSAADDMLQGYVDDLRSRVADQDIALVCHHRLEVGTPAHRIVEIAKEENAVHIVMGTRGRGALRGILLGSTAQRVVQLAKIPVTLVKAGVADAEGGASG